MYSFTKQNPLILLKMSIVSVFIISIPGCKKEPDYRDKYTGNYVFTVDGNRFISGVPLDQQIQHFPTVTVNGTIRNYTSGDYKLDLNPRSSTEYEDMDQRITIIFSNSVTPVITENGMIIEEYDIHYHIKGQFNNEDEIEFIVDNLGTAGYSITYRVKGTRK